MIDIQRDEGLRGNPKIKLADTTEFVEGNILEHRLEELKRILEDPIYFAEKYFYIINLDEGKQLIKIYPKQAEMVKAMCNRQRVIVLASRQCGKSTSYSIFALWFILANKDKNILICANRFKTATDILMRIQMAYQELPNWLKPGVVEWNKSKIVFDNGCSISAEATSANSGRGGSCNVLICDEFAFLKQGVEAEFMESVFPTISSSKTSKIIIVSTPRGMGNEFYKIYSKASLDLDDKHVDKNLRWTPVRVDWWDVPGRDEKWKEHQIETFGGNTARFLQEFGNSFLGSVETLIEPEVIENFKAKFEKGHKEYKEVQLHKQFEKTRIKIFYPPEKGHAYIIGGDPAMGTKSDFHAMSVFDITNTYHIKQVASYYDNETPPKVFAYMLAKVATLYNNAYIAMENNGCSEVTLDAIWRDYDYDYIVSEGGTAKASIGIHSSNTRKVEACLNFKSILEDKDRSIEINDGQLIAEMETFEKKSTLAKVPTYCAVNGHDDIIMATIWAFFTLKLEIAERYYDVRKVVLNKLGEQMPLFILPYQVNKAEVEEDYMSSLDRRLNSYRTEYEKSAEEAKKMAENQEFDNFIKQNNLDAYDADSEEADARSNEIKADTGEEEFTFGGFF